MKIHNYDELDEKIGVELTEKSQTKRVKMEGI